MTPTARATTFDDPFSYCAAVGTIDAPDSRYVGAAMPQAVEDAIRERFGLGSTEPGGGTSWRCLDGKLLACTIGANLPCGKADTSREPTPAMVEFCQGNPWEDYIPKAVTGHSTIYAWDCRGGEPMIATQEFEVDARGFIADFWYEVTASESVYEARMSALGFTPYGSAVSTAIRFDGVIGSLEAVKGICAGSDGYCQQVFFFHNGEYLGTDTLSPSRSILDVQYAGVAKIAVTYANYAPSDAPCCPSLSPVTITYSWDGNELQASGLPPGH